MDAVSKAAGKPGESQLTGGGPGLRVLYLLRHAKSSWQDNSLKDKDRPLNPRGIKSCQLMAGLCQQRGVQPDRILVSDALRTTQTYEHLARAASLQAEPRFDGALYRAGAGDLLRYLAEVEDQQRSVLLIGHNPALHDLALLLARKGRTEDLDRLESKFPTCALAEIHLALDHWRDIGTCDGRLVHFDIPKALRGGAK